jgi:hypothetical protein
VRIVRSSGGMRRATHRVSHSPSSLRAAPLAQWFGSPLLPDFNSTRQSDDIDTAQLVHVSGHAETDSTAQSGRAHEVHC